MFNWRAILGAADKGIAAGFGSFATSSFVNGQYSLHSLEAAAGAAVAVTFYIFRINLAKANAAKS